MNTRPIRRTVLPFVGAAALAALLAHSARADYSSTVISQGPVGYWRLNETTQPPVLPIAAANSGSLGAAANGDNLNGPIRGQPGALSGSPDTSYRFTNPTLSAGYLGPHIDVPNNPSLNPSGPFTVEFWAKPSSNPTTLLSPVGSLDTSLNGVLGRNGYLFYIDPATGWQFRLGGPNGYGNNIAAGGGFTVGAWHHIVGVYDGSNMILYVNGAPATNVAVAAGSYTPNSNQPFRIAATTILISGTASPRTFDGWIDEVAVYGTALSASTIKSHFDTASTNGAGYATQILASAPVGYWRLDEPGDPVAANIGTLGSAGNGNYIYNCRPGVTSIRPPTYAGLDAGNNAVAFGGSGGYVTLPQLNLVTNAMTITCWVNVTNQQAAGAGLVLNHTVSGSAGLAIDLGGIDNSLSYSWNDDNATYNQYSGVILPDSDWAFVALIVQPNQAAIFAANTTDYTSFTGWTNPVSHALQAITGPTLIGADLDIPSASAATGGGPAYLNGAVDEVAIFGRALSVGEVFTEYAAAVNGVPPQIFGGPVASATQLYDGDTLSLSVDAGGTLPFGYQWRNGGTAIQGATSSAYVKANVQAAADSGNYDVVISNAFGAVTSAPPVSITVLPVTPPVISQNPASRTLYLGGTLDLTVIASGGHLAYQWQVGNSPIPGATSSAFVVPSVVPANAGAYTVTITNELGSATSSPPAVVSVIAPAAGTFEATIVADAPEAWWRLDDSAGSTNMLDAMGRHDGTYVGNIGLGVPGVSGGADTAANFDGTTYGIVPFSPALNTEAFTIECWAKAVNLSDSRVPVASTSGTRGWWFLSGVPAAGQWTTIIFSGGGQFYLPSTVASMQTNVWTHLVFAYDPTEAPGGLRFYINGNWDGGDFGDFDRNVAGPFLIGTDGVTDTPSFWKGQLDEVAFYTNAFSLAQVQAHYSAALYGNTTKPLFTLQPQSQIAGAGSQVSFKATAVGSEPIVLQWRKDSAALLNETNDTLIVSNLTSASQGTYQVTATNVAGTTASSAATLVVNPAPTSANLTNGLVLHLRFDGDYLDSSGLGNDGTPGGIPTFIPGVIGTNAVYLSTDVPNTTFNYVSLAPTNSLSFGAADSFSLSFWVNFTNVPGDLPMIGNAKSSTYNPGWVFANDGGQLEYTLGANDSTSVIADPVGGPAINDGKWHNVVATFDRTAGVANTYIDGVQVDLRSIKGLGGLDNGNLIALGQDPNGTYDPSRPNKTFKGSFEIDDVGIWRTVLSTYDAQGIYQGGLGGKSFDVPSALPPTLSFGKQGNSWVITYTGTLYSSSSVTGPYAPESGAVSPYTVPASTTIKFYRAHR